MSKEMKGELFLMSSCLVSGVQSFSSLTSSGWADLNY